MEIQILSVKDLSQAVVQKRKALGLSQIDCAGLLGVGTRFLSELERGKETLESGKVLQVLNGLGFTITLKAVKETP